MAASTARPGAREAGRLRPRRETGGRGAAAASLLQAVTLLLLLALFPSTARAAVAFDPALWNGYARYEATGVPEALMFPRRDADGAGSGSSGDSDPVGGAPLFPLQLGEDLMADCHGPTRPFPSAADQRKPDACMYEPTGNHMWRFWQILEGPRLRLANCYCYSLDAFPGGWCFPGLGGGMGELLQSNMDCADLSKRVQADGGVPASRAEAVYGPPNPPGAGAGAHYIALFFRPLEACDFARCDKDFHLLRRDAGGAWSQKAGESPATDLDADGKRITDPEAAHIEGGYREFCGYFRVDPATMRVGTQDTPNAVDMRLARWRAAGLPVRVTPLPYDPKVDVSDAAARERDMERMQRLQRGEGPDPQQAQQQQQQQQPKAASGRRLLMRGRRV